MTLPPARQRLQVLCEQASTCQRCDLSKTRTHVVFGEGNSDAKYFFVGEAPGLQEDVSGRPFVGRSGKLLERLIVEELGVSREAVYIANVVKCRPPANRNPKAVELMACRDYLKGQLLALEPKVIVTLGAFAARSVLGTSIGITSLRGKAYLSNDTAVVPTFHPAAALRGGLRVLELLRSDLALAALVTSGEAKLWEL